MAMDRSTNEITSIEPHSVSELLSRATNPALDTRQNDYRQVEPAALPRTYGLTEKHVQTRGLK